MLIDLENTLIRAILTSLYIAEIFDFILTKYLLVSPKVLLISVFQSLLGHLT